MVFSTPFDSNTIVLNVFDLLNKTTKSIYKGLQISSLIFDNSGRMLAFIVPGEAGRKIWKYEMQDSKATDISLEQPTTDSNLHIFSINRF